jgi:hypothetical protein
MTCLVVLAVAANAGVLLANGNYQTYNTSPAKPDSMFTVDTAGTHAEDANGDDWYATAYPHNQWKYVKAGGQETAHMESDGTYTVYHADGSVKETGSYRRA